jgi:hypothetical protein
MKDQKDPNVFQIAFSMLASFFGVQNKANFDRDDAYVEKKGLKPYIIMGIILVVLFHIVLITLVKVITYYAA